jgi:type II secretory pathway pseudopilin PulG
MIWCFHCDYRERLRDRLRKRRATAGFSLVDILASILVVGICVGSAIASMASINRLAEVNRSLNYAVALCQERIAQTVASPFSPPTIVPSFFGTTWPIPGTETVTSTETVQLYTDVNGSSAVTGTRTTLVSLASAPLNLIRVTARINYTYRGKDYVCETFTLRTPD